MASTFSYTFAYDRQTFKYKIQSCAWNGEPIPWAVSDFSIDVDYRYKIELRFAAGGIMQFSVDKVEARDATPPKPKCETCGQEISSLTRAPF